MKWAERIVMVLLVVVLTGGVAWGYFAVKHEREEVRAAVARGEYQIPDTPAINTQTKAENWQAIYPNTISVTIGSVMVQASVADSLAKRIKGLSGTPFLPEEVVKLFAFGIPGSHSIWMKDMNYALDIIWADKEGVIVHIERDISPETFPSSFGSPAPAWYVIEAAAGFVSSNNIKIGDKISL
jgi:uncharacterized membrane protein (UPF0127 family)